MSKRYAIVADVETNGLEEKHVVIQLAAIAVDQDTWLEVSSFERKVKFNARESSLKALEINRYDPAVWSREAKELAEVISDFCNWAQPYFSIRMWSEAKKKEYMIGKLIGHNMATFDLPRIRRMFGEGFFPFSYQTPDTLQLAMWFWDLQPNLERPANLKLTTLAEYFGIKTDGAHDALADVRLSAAVARAVRDRLFGGNGK